MYVTNATQAQGVPSAAIARRRSRPRGPRLVRAGQLAGLGFDISDYLPDLIKTGGGIATAAITHGSGGGSSAPRTPAPSAGGSGGSGSGLVTPTVIAGGVGAIALLAAIMRR